MRGLGKTRIFGCFQAVFLRAGHFGAFRLTAAIPPCWLAKLWPVSMPAFIEAAGFIEARSSKEQAPLMTPEKRVSAKAIRSRMETGQQDHRDEQQGRSPYGKIRCFDGDVVDCLGSGHDSL